MNTSNKNGSGTSESAAAARSAPSSAAAKGTARASAASFPGHGSGACTRRSQTISPGSSAAASSRHASRSPGTVGTRLADAQQGTLAVELGRPGPGLTAELGYARSIGAHHRAVTRGQDLHRLLAARAERRHVRRPTVDHSRPPHMRAAAHQLDFEKRTVLVPPPQMVRPLGLEATLKHMHDRTPGRIKRHRITPLARIVDLCPPVAVRGEQLLRHRRQRKKEATERISQSPLARRFGRRREIRRSQRVISRANLRKVALPRVHVGNLATGTRQRRLAMTSPTRQALPLEAVSSVADDAAEQGRRVLGDPEQCGVGPRSSGRR